MARLSTAEIFRTDAEDSLTWCKPEDFEYKTLMRYCFSAAEESCASYRQWRTKIPLSPLFQRTTNTDCFQSLCPEMSRLYQEQPGLLLHQW